MLIKIWFGVQYYAEGDFRVTIAQLLSWYASVSKDPLKTVIYTDGSWYKSNSVMYAKATKAMQVPCHVQVSSPGPKVQHYEALCIVHLVSCHFLVIEGVFYLRHIPCYPNCSNISIFKYFASKKR